MNRIGEGAGRHRRQKPQGGISPDPGLGGLEIWRRENGHTSSPEFNTFGKRILKARRLGVGVPICPRHLPLSPLSSKLSLGWIQFLISLTKRGVSISGREKGKFGPTQPASRFPLSRYYQPTPCSPPAYPQPPCPQNLPPSSPPHQHPSYCLLGQETPLPGHTQRHPRRGHKAFFKWPHLSREDREKANRPFNACPGLKIKKCLQWPVASCSAWRKGSGILARADAGCSGLVAATAVADTNTVLL